jgi:hypothetical protein
VLIAERLLPELGQPHGLLAGEGDVVQPRHAYDPNVVEIGRWRRSP